MTRFGTGSWLLAVALAPALVAASPAAAQRFTLSGRYECLAGTEEACYDATPTGPGPFWEPPEPGVRTPESIVDASHAPAPPSEGPPPDGPESDPPFVKPQKPGPAAPGDPLKAMTPRLLARKPAPDDIAILRSRATKENPKAIEMLAWCYLGGVGVPRDPVNAWALYGEAARAGAAEARKTQAMIFKKQMTPEQRQQALEIENGRQSAGG